MDKAAFVEVDGERVGKITPFEAELEHERPEGREAYILKVNCPPKKAPDVEKVIYNGVEYVKKEKNGNHD